MAAERVRRVAEWVRRGVPEPVAGREAELPGRPVAPLAEPLDRRPEEPSARPVETPWAVVRPVEAPWAVVLPAEAPRASLPRVPGRRVDWTRAVYGHACDMPAGCCI